MKRRTEASAQASAQASRSLSPSDRVLQTYKTDNMARLDLIFLIYSHITSLQTLYPLDLEPQPLATSHILDSLIRAVVASSKPAAPIRPQSFAARPDIISNHQSPVLSVPKVGLTACTTSTEMVNERSTANELWGKERLSIIMTSVVLGRSVQETTSILKREHGGEGVDEMDVEFYIKMTRRSRTSRFISHPFERRRLINSYQRQTRDCGQSPW